MSQSVRRQLVENSVAEQAATTISIRNLSNLSLILTKRQKNCGNQAIQGVKVL